MPLKEGSGHKSVGLNIEMLIGEGRPKRQAIAIALRKAGKAMPNRNKGGGGGRRMSPMSLRKMAGNPFHMAGDKENKAY